MYGPFAEVYDEFMQDVSYEQWADYMERLWRRWANIRSWCWILPAGQGV